MLGSPNCLDHRSADFEVERPLFGHGHPGFGLIVQILLEEMGDLTGGPQGISGIPKLSDFGVKIYRDFELYFLVWGLVMVVQVMVINLIRGKVGRAFLAIHTNEAAAESLGVDTARLKLSVFVISAALAGSGGCLCFFHQLSQPRTVWVRVFHSIGDHGDRRRDGDLWGRFWVRSCWGFCRKF